METVTQVVFVLFHLTVAAFAFTMIGETPEGDNRRKSVATTTFIYGLFTIGIILWWGTPDIASTIAKYGTIALLWVPWATELPKINKPFGVVKTWTVVVGVSIIAARIVAVLVFWH
jgi:hypothetical protein